MDLLERSSALGELGGLLAATATGGRVVLVAGEAGIGKSALVRALLVGATGFEPVTSSVSAKIQGTAVPGAVLPGRLRPSMLEGNALLASRETPSFRTSDRAAMRLFTFSALTNQGMRRFSRILHSTSGRLMAR